MTWISEESCLLALGNAENVLHIQILGGCNLMELTDKVSDLMKREYFLFLISHSVILFSFLLVPPIVEYIVAKRFTPMIPSSWVSYLGRYVPNLRFTRSNIQNKNIAGKGGEGKI